MNRHEDAQVIYKTNINLVNSVIAACQKTNSKPKIIFSTSTQENADNLFGNSKKEDRKACEAWALENETSVISCVMPNVFGIFGKPNFSSVIATFCQKLVNN